MSNDIKNALRSVRDLDEYLEVRSSREILDDIKSFGGHEGLRDVFAGQALAGGFARSELPEYDLRALFGDRTGIRREEILAADAYRIADAMLARRNKP